MRSMREAIALWLIQKILKGDTEMMAMLYASKIVMEAENKKTGQSWRFADVPAKLKAQVAEIIIDQCALPELVPAEFGGTAEAS